MKLHIKVSRAARQDIPVLRRAIFFMSQGPCTVRRKRIRGEDWILVDAPHDPCDNHTFLYNTRGFSHLHTGVEE